MGILQARILKGVAISPSGGSSQPRDQTWVSCIAGRDFTNCTTKEELQFNPKLGRKYSEGWGMGEGPMLRDLWRSITTLYCSQQTTFKLINEEITGSKMANRTGRSLSPPQIHQKIIWMLSKLHKTTSGCWQRTSGTQKGSPFSSKGGRTKYKR